jgi:hypothetical protein
MPPRRDPAKEERLAKFVKRTLEWEFRKAAIHRQKLQGPDGDRPWNERTVRDVWSLKVMELEAASKRAQQGGTQVQLGVVVIPQRIESADAWEQRKDAIEAELALRPALPPGEGK